MREQEWLTCEDPTRMLKSLKGWGSARQLRLFACEAVRHFLETTRRHSDVVDIVNSRLPDLAWLWDLPVVASEYADGLVDDATLEKVAGRAAPFADRHRWFDSALVCTTMADPWDAADQVLWALDCLCTDELHLPGLSANLESFLDLWLGSADSQRLAALLRDIVGNPFQPPPVIDPNWLAWNQSTVPRLALAIYERHAFGRSADLMAALGELDALGNNPNLDGVGYLSTNALAWIPGEIEHDEYGVLADAMEDAGCTDPALLDHLRSPGPHVRGCWVLDLLLGKS